MRKIIETKLRPLVGLELTSTTRKKSIECLKFEFKELFILNSEKVNKGEYALHIQCEWRAIKGHKIVVGSRDLYEPSNKTKVQKNKKFDYKKENLRDVKFKRFIKKNKLVVQAIEVDEYGGFNIYFSDDCIIQIIPIKTSKSKNNEYWRLLNNIDENSEQFVIGRKEMKQNELTNL